MTSPKHLWSGDWEHESRAAQSSLPLARPPVEEPPRPQPPNERPPARPSYLGRRIVVLSVLAALVVAGVVWAISSSGSNNSSASSSTSPKTSTGPAGGVGTATVPGLGGPIPPATSPQPGTTTNPTTAAQADALGLQLGLVPVNRVIVQSVVPGSPADQVGIGADDLLLAINGTRVTSPAQANAIIARLPKGSRVVLQLVQGSEQITATIQESNGP